MGIPEVNEKRIFSGLRSQRVKKSAKNSGVLVGHLQRKFSSASSGRGQPGEFEMWTDVSVSMPPEGCPLPEGSVRVPLIRTSLYSIPRLRWWSGTAAYPSLSRPLHPILEPNNLVGLVATSRPKMGLGIALWALVRGEACCCCY